jgi:hypothetical protein
MKSSISCSVGRQISALACSTVHRHELMCSVSLLLFHCRRVSKGEASQQGQCYQKD